MAYPYACGDEAEDGDLPLQSLLSVSLTNSSLLTTVSRVDDAFSDALAYLTPHLAAPNLGLARLPNDNGYDAPASRAAYWTAVRNHIAILPNAAANKSRPITTLVLQGSGGSLHELGEAVRDALGPLGAALKEQTVEEDTPPPLWAAARGAALYARRRQEAPANCQEAQHCITGAQDAVEELDGFGQMGVPDQEVISV